MRNTLLFMLCSFVWGSTWFAITMQLGEVDPLWSIAYRFLLAASLVALVCHLKKQFVRYTFRQHLRLIMQGACLCGFSYWLVYLSELYITSALSALTCTSVLYLNVIIGRVWLGNPVRMSVLIGGILGTLGILMIFMPDVGVDDDGSTLKGLTLAFSSCILFSIGSVACEHNEREGLGLLPVVTYNMFYGGLMVCLIAVLKGTPPAWVWSTEYIGSLLYLVCFGSVGAMVSYVALIRRIGADRTAYVDFVYPIVALCVSIFFEGYQWTLLTVFGIAMVMIGNLFALGAFSRFLPFNEEL